MVQNLKVEFIDNAELQYDENADRIKVKGVDSKGKLYLGDRFAASMLQLRHRSCKAVVNCCSDTHGLAKETDVKYLKIDPDDDGDSFFTESYDFIEKVLSKNKSVVVHCDNGNIKSGAIVLYYVMKKKGISLAESYRIVRKYRASLKVKPSLIKKLATAEKALHGVVTLMHDGKSILFLDEALSQFGDKKLKGKLGNAVSPLYILLGVGAFFACIFGAIVVATGKI